MDKEKGGSAFNWDQIAFLELTFEQICRHDKGKLHAKDLYRIFNEQGMGVSQRECFWLLCDFDVKEQGFLDFEDFKRLVEDQSFVW